MAAHSNRLHLGHCLTCLAAHTEQMAHEVNWRLEDMVTMFFSAFGPGHSTISHENGTVLGHDSVCYDLSSYSVHVGHLYNCLLLP